MTTQEKAFADEYVFCYFNGTETVSARIAEIAAIKAGYVIPTDTIEKDSFCKSLLNKEGVKTYITGQINTFTTKLASDQRRNLWRAIAEMEIGELSTEFGGALPLKVG